MAEVKPSILYRWMEEDADGFPETGNQRNKLGVRYSIEGKIPSALNYTVADVDVVAGMITNMKHGMSACMDYDTGDKPPHAEKNTKLRLFNKKIKWFSIMTNVLSGFDLISNADERDRNHFFISPMIDPNFEKYQANLIRTKNQWK